MNQSEMRGRTSNRIRKEKIKTKNSDSAIIIILQFIKHHYITVKHQSINGAE